MKEESIATLLSMTKRKPSLESIATLLSVAIGTSHSIILLLQQN